MRRGGTSTMISDDGIACLLPRTTDLFVAAPMESHD